MNKIVVKRSDGGVSILIPTHEATPETMLRDALRVEGYVSHREISDDSIPSNRIFRNAWTDDLPTPTIDVDLTKAKSIKLDQFRILRAPLLAKLDIQFQRALEEANETKKADIINSKQILRDVTSIPLPDDIDELAAFIPDCLQ